MFFLEDVVLLVDSCENCRGDVDLLSFLAIVNLVRMELGDILAISRPDSRRFHEFVHSDPF